MIPITAPTNRNVLWTVILGGATGSVFDSVATAEPWANLKFAGIVTVPGALWVFVRQYTTRRGLSRRRASACRPAASAC